MFVLRFQSSLCLGSAQRQRGTWFLRLWGTKTSHLTSYCSTAGKSEFGRMSFFLSICLFVSFQCSVFKRLFFHFWSAARLIWTRILPSTFTSQRYCCRTTCAMRRRRPEITRPIMPNGEINNKEMMTCWSVPYRLFLGSARPETLWSVSTQHWPRCAWHV